MQTSAVEEAELTKDTNEPQPPTTPPEAQEPEPTALAPAEPEVIEGEVIVIEQPESIDDHIPPMQKPYWLLIPFTVFVCLVFVAASSFVSLLTPSATVAIIPVERSITTTEAIQVQGRLLPALTISQSITVPTTGTMHQDASRAEGSITFYNGLLTPQTIAAGTILSGSDGIKIITDQPATIPKATPPVEGHIAVSAHALSTGASGNILILDIDQACCANSVLAKNTTAFRGGAPARDFIIVTKHDLETATGAIKITLLKSEQAALATQLNPGEALIPQPCNPTVSSDHRPGEEAKQVTVTVSDTCTGIAYAAHDVDATATQMITTDAVNRLGSGYSPIGDIQTTIVQATIHSTRQGGVHVTVQAAGTWVYQITPRIQAQLAVLIAGKTKQQAIAILLQFPGIAGAQITLQGGNPTLPQDANALRIHILYNPAAEG
jgi:hypothetical protein